MQLAVDKQFYIIADEIYEKLVYGAAKHVAVATLSPEAYTHTILIGGVSKSYAMTGLRIGFAAGPVDVIAGMVNYQSQSTSAPNSAAQHAAAVAYTMDQSCVEEMRQQFEKRRNYIVERINAIPGVSCPNNVLLLISISDQMGYDESLTFLPYIKSRQVIYMHRIFHSK